MLIIKSVIHLFLLILQMAQWTQLLQIKFETVISLSSHSGNFLLMLYQYLQFDHPFSVSKNLADPMRTLTSVADQVLI